MTKKTKKSTCYL